MKHPVDRRERFLIGKRLGEKRTRGYWGYWSTTHFRNEMDRECFEKGSKLRRNTTKLCSCSMCGNPRRVAWKDKLTMREKKFKDWKFDI